jgi:hypothetical protein
MSNNPSDFNDPNRQGQPPPPQWNTTQPEENNPQSQYPSSSQYPYTPSSYPPPSQYPPPFSSTAMTTIHPQTQGSQDTYRLPHPSATYQQRGPDMYGPPPPPQLVYQAAAPRQRTAIACRYCRRRKIRCSGFESSQDGRCSNCIRFNQECMFTPVSSQAQAFVPAHAAYPHLRNQAQGRGRSGYPADGLMLYGAHGQPLPPQQQPGPDATLPPPQGIYQHPYGRSPHLDERGAPPSLAHPSIPQDQVSRKRPRLDHSPSSVPSSPTFPQRQPTGRRNSSSGFEYPDPTNLAPVSPAVSTPSYPSHSGPYYQTPPQHDRRPSPQSSSAYQYDRRPSGSPHNSPYPPIQSGHVTPPPPPSSATAGSASSRGGLNVRDILNPGDQAQGGRSSTDSDMLNALNRRV